MHEQDNIMVTLFTFISQKVIVYSLKRGCEGCNECSASKKTIRMFPFSRLTRHNTQARDITPSRVLAEETFIHAFTADDV